MGSVRAGSDEWPLLISKRCGFGMTGRTLLYLAEETNLWCSTPAWVCNDWRRCEGKVCCSNAVGGMLEWVQLYVKFLEFMELFYEEFHTSQRAHESSFSSLELRFLVVGTLKIVFARLCCIKYFPTPQARRLGRWLRCHVKDSTKRGRCPSKLSWIGLECDVVTGHGIRHLYWWIVFEISQSIVVLKCQQRRCFGL